MNREDAEALRERLNRRAPPGVRYEVCGEENAPTQLALGREPVTPFYVRRVVHRSRPAVELPLADSGTGDRRRP